METRKKLRLNDYDYSADGYYFITICTADKRKILCDPPVQANCVRPISETQEKLHNPSPTEMAKLLMYATTDMATVRCQKKRKKFVQNVQAIMIDCAKMTYKALPIMQKYHYFLPNLEKYIIGNKKNKISSCNLKK